MKRMNILAAALAAMVAGAGLTAFGTAGDAAPIPIHKQNAQAGENQASLLQDVANRRLQRRGVSRQFSHNYSQNRRYDRRRYANRYNYRRGNYRNYYRGHHYSRRYNNFYIGLPGFYYPYYYNNYGYNDYSSGYGNGYGYSSGYGGGHVQWCLNRYRSYNVRTNTFRGYDGYNHRCISPYS